MREIPETGGSRSEGRAWEARLDDAVDRLLADPAATRAEFLNALIENGIRERLAPSDPEERALRQAQGRKLWEGSREDPNFTRRIMYMTAFCKDASARHATLTGPVAAILSYVYKVARSDRYYDFFPEAKEDTRFNPMENAIDGMQALSREELLAKGEDAAIIPLGAEGFIEGIPVVISRYTDDGEVVLEAKSYEDHLKLGEVMKRLVGRYIAVVPPELLDPANFTPPGGKAL